jgi:hypothetical protein
MKFSDIEDALMFVSDGFYGDHSAMVCKSTGQICWASESGDTDDIPEEAYESDDWVAVPHKNDLELGRDLVFKFISQHLPDDSDRVGNFFHSRGAYTRYKDLLEKRGLLQEWYDFENARVEKAIREWCRDNGIEITG